MNMSNKDTSFNSHRVLTLNSNQHRLQLKEVILNDFTKVKTKCDHYYVQLGELFSKKEHFDKIQRTTAMKVELLDLQGIVELKNELIRALTQLYDIQHQLVYKKQRNQMRYNSPQAPREIKRSQFPPQIEKFTLQVPIYNSREQENLSKIQRISSYMFDLRKNMRRLSTAIFKNYETSDFLMNEPEYLQLKEKLQRYKMRNEELQHILQRKIEEQVKRFIASCECVQENEEYKVVKVYDSDVADLGKQYQFTQINEWEDNIVREGDYRDFKNKAKSKSKNKLQFSNFNSPKDVRSLQKININSKQAHLQMKHSRCKDPPDTSTNKILNSNSIIKRSNRVDSKIQDQTKEKINEKIEESTEIIQSLQSLRSKRKKVFNDDIWDEFDKI